MIITVLTREAVAKGLYRDVDLHIYDHHHHHHLLLHDLDSFSLRIHTTIYVEKYKINVLTSKVISN